VTLIAEEGGVAVADVSAVPMRQNVRGVIYQMAGIAESAVPTGRRLPPWLVVCQPVLGSSTAPRRCWCW